MTSPSRHRARLKAGLTSRATRLGVWFAAALALLMPGAQLPAQVARAGNALQLVTVRPAASGRMQYYYQVLGPSGPGMHSEVLLWLEQPLGLTRTHGSTARSGGGRLLFDAATDSADAPWRHPDLAVVTPPHWTAAILPDGALHWGAARAQGYQSYGVASRRVLIGFALESPAVPALRRFRVVPERRFETDRTAEQEGLDTLMVMPSGLVLAPGWNPSLVHWGFLYDQTRLACEYHYLTVEQCGRFYRWLDVFQAAHLRRNDQEYLQAILGMERDLAADGAVHPWVRRVTQAALVAMRRNPPTHLPPLPPESRVAPAGASPLKP